MTGRMTLFRHPNSKSSRAKNYTYSLRKYKTRDFNPSKYNFPLSFDTVIHRFSLEFPLEYKESLARSE